MLPELAKEFTGGLLIVTIATPSSPTSMRTLLEPILESLCMRGIKKRTSPSEWTFVCAVQKRLVNNSQIYNESISCLQKPLYSMLQTSIFIEIVKKPHKVPQTSRIDNGFISICLMILVLLCSENKHTKFKNTEKEAY